MIGDGGMGYIGGPQARHVATGAFLGRLVCTCLEDRGMARETHLLNFLRAVLRVAMRIVAGAAPQAAATLRGALAAGE